MCMNLRSKGTSNLVPRAAEIRALERECARKRRQEEQQAQNQELNVEMDPPQHVNGDNNNNAPPGPVHQPRPARAIGAYDRPNVNGQRLGIRAPPVAANNFEVKPGLLNVIENNKYHGLPVEDPFDHLDKFDSYCGLSKTNGVSEDAFKLKLFPFSLGDKARQWEKTVPSDTITTWDECKKAFLEKFFSSSRTAKLRNEISSFQQKNMEGFSEAWERFKGYQSKCPHHGFSKESLLSTFYRGALPKYRARLDTASNGFFLGRTEQDAEELVDNMVKSDAVYSEEHDRGNRGDDKQTRKEIKALEDKIDLLIAEKATQEQIKAVGNTTQEESPVVNEVDGLEGQEELCFINNNGSWYKKEPNFQYNYPQKSYSNNQQGGYQPRNNQQSNFQPQQNPSPSSSAPQESSTDALLKQILESQTRSEKHVGYELKNLHSKIDGSYNELNNKFFHLASSVKNLENQFASMSTHQNRQPGSLPGKSDQNPKEAKAVTLRSGKQLPPTTLTKDVAKQGEEVAINLDDEVIIVDEKTDDEILAKIVKAKGKGKVGEEKNTTKGGESAAPASESSSVPPPYEPKLPFPGRFKKQLLQKYTALFEKQMSEVQITMPIIDAFMLVPQYSKFLKDAVAAKKKEMESMLTLTHECNAIIQRLDAPEKQEDPGCFTLPCAIGPVVFEKCLCDLGASVSLMPLSVAKKLGFTQYKKCRLSLVLADRSVKYPVGILENLPVKIGRYEIPTDFVVLEMGEEAHDPLILGRPFLATAGAIVNVKEGKIDLHLGKETILHFNIKEKIRNPTVLGQAFTIEEMSTPAEEELEDLPPEDDEEGTSPSTPSP